MIAAYVTAHHAGEQRAAILARYDESEITWYVETDLATVDQRWPTEQLTLALQAVAREGLDALVVDDPFRLGMYASQAWVAARVGPGRFRPIIDGDVWEISYDRDPNENRAHVRSIATAFITWGDEYRERNRVIRRRQAGYRPWPATPANVPYGYVAVQGVAVPDPDARDALRMGLALRDAGATWAAIGEYWIATGFHPRPDTRQRRRHSGWDGGTVRKIVNRARNDLEPAELSSVARSYLPRGGRVPRPSLEK